MSIPLCSACLGSIHCGGEPDFPYHHAREGEDCGAADHAALEEEPEMNGTYTPPAGHKLGDFINPERRVLAHKGTTATLTDLGNGLFVLRLEYPRVYDDGTGDISDDDLLAFASAFTGAELTDEALMWDAQERETTTGTIVDLAVTIYGERRS